MKRLKLFRGVTFCICIIAWLNCAEAGIFQCAKENGQIEFRDRPCSTSLDNQTYVSRSKKTQVKLVKAEEKEVKGLVKQQKKQDKATLRRKNQLQKKHVKELAKEERRELRCARIQEKIDLLENQLKQGYKLKRYQRIQAKLAHEELMMERYCKASDA